MKTPILPNFDNLKSNYPELFVDDWDWHIYEDYYDGPLDGLIESNGKRYYAFWITEHLGQDRKYSSRVFAVIELTDERLKYEEFWLWFLKFVNKSNNITKEITDFMFAFYDGRYEKDYIPMDIASGKDGKVIGWCVE